MQYKAQLQTTKNDSLKIHEYWAKIKNIANNLEAVGEIIMELDLFYHILSGLGPKFDVVSENIIFRLEDVTLIEVYTKLLAYENKLEDYNVIVIVNSGGNDLSSSSCANNVVYSSKPMHPNGINMNLSTSDFGNLNFNNIVFVGRNIDEFNPANSSLIGRFCNIRINTQQPGSYLSYNTNFSSNNFLNSSKGNGHNNVFGRGFRSDKGK